jgi:pimeloyl-ACP methyl ester carboxylesterase
MHAVHLLAKWWWILVALAMSGCAWMDAKQRELIYRPTPGVLAQWEAITPTDLPLWLEGGRPGLRLRAMWVPQADPQAPAVLYLHGTFRNLFQNRAKIAAIHAAGFAVLAVDYRGWGESTPDLPSEATIVQDAEIAWEEFVQRVPRAESRVIYGHSMGSAAAVQLAWQHRSGGEYGALVLESAFTSMPDIARDRGGIAALLGAMSTQHFNSLALIAGIPGPKWFITGTDDRTVPTAHSQRLYDAASGPRRLVVIEGGGHSHLQDHDAPRYQATWREVAEALGAPPPAR